MDDDDEKSFSGLLEDELVDYQTVSDQFQSAECL